MKLITSLSMSKLSITSLGCPGLQKERDLPHLCLQNPPVYEVQHEHQQQFAEKQDAGTAGMAKGRRATNALLLVQYPRKLQVNLWDFGFYRDNSTPARLKVAYSTTRSIDFNVLIHKGPCTQIGYTLAPKFPYRDYLTLSPKHILFGYMDP